MRDLLPLLLLSLAIPCSTGQAQSRERPGMTAQDSTTARQGLAVRLSPTVVRAEQAMSAASSRTVRALDLQVRPRASAQELLRLAPGLVIAQHAGGGKAEQIFLRGFDADHGTDVAISVDGLPVNLVSHGHGQGYADLHFVIPEIVERLDVRKGPHDVRDGDLAVAGSIGLVTRDRVERQVDVVGGSFGSARATLLAPFGGDMTRTGGYVAAALAGSDGPFEQPQGLRRRNLFTRVTTPWRGAFLRASLSAFDASWNASGQVPERAIRSGLIPRFGAIDSTEGGQTSRVDANASLRGGTPRGTTWEARAYASRYRFQLFSNFTFLATDTVRGDGIEQGDARMLGGAEAMAQRLAPLFGAAGVWRTSGGSRIDAADVTLFHARGRQRLATRRDDAVTVLNSHATVERMQQVTARMRATVGVRGDHFRFAVHDRTGAAPRSARSEAIVSPRVSLAFDATEHVALFAAVGRGFHSNDARAAVAGGSALRALPAARGEELGVRATSARATVAAAVWRIDLQSELVWSGDEGTTEASGRTRRVGLDLEGRFVPARWIALDADVSLARGRFRDAPRGARHIPLAPAVMSTGGVTLGGGMSWSTALRWRHVGARPASDDGSIRARGHALVEWSAQRRLGPYTLRLAIDNALDATWNEAQFATTSRLRGEADPVTELHFTPGTPRAVQVGISRRF